MYKKSIDLINKNGFLLMFPVNNGLDPKSLWSLLYPKIPLRWEWSDDADDRVVKMWILMKKLSESPEVVYSKWYNGRATFFSKEVFRALLSMNFDAAKKSTQKRLNVVAEEILEILIESSPRSTKEVKKLTGLQGKLNEASYQKAMKSLFERFLIVGFGEVDDGAFPSLAVGATQTLHEDLWQEALDQDFEKSVTVVRRTFDFGSRGYKFLMKIGLEVELEATKRTD